MYRAPLKDLIFTIEELLGVSSLATLPRYREFSSELVGSVLEEAARFAEEVLAPINRSGDELGARFEAGAVHMPPKFAEAYRAFVGAGWTQLTAPTQYGGQGAPLV